MAKTVSQCAKDLHKLRKETKWKRITLSAEYFRKIVGRSRIEESFLKELNSDLLSSFQLVIFRIPKYGAYLLVSTEPRYLKDDPFIEGDED